MDENAVVDAVCAHLRVAGYEVLRQCTTTEHGVDIIARHTGNGRMMYVEAKGGTSSREGSNRFGKPFTQPQVFDRVSKGVFTALQLRSEHSDTGHHEVALAVPDSRWFRRYLASISQHLSSAGIRILFVAEDRTITEFSRS